MEEALIGIQDKLADAGGFKEELDFQYKILDVRQQQIEGRERWTNDYLLSTYVQCTDGIIGRLDGSIPIEDDVWVHDEEGGMKQEKRSLGKPDAAVFLDKSARPVEWMVRAMWDTLATKQKGDDGSETTPERPDTSYFVNIDKGDWLRMIGVLPEHIEDSRDQDVDFEKIPDEMITRIRAVFSKTDITEENLEDAWEHPTVLDGKEILIVDEVVSSGMTLKIAKYVFSRAIPEATFTGAYWAQPEIIPLGKGARKNTEPNFAFTRKWVPVWYTAETASGRGVGEKNPARPDKLSKQGKAPSRVSKIGRYILSTPPHDPETQERASDDKAKRLREEIKQLGKDLSAGDVLYIPSGDRPHDTDEEFEHLKERISRLNGGITYEEWMAKRDAIQPVQR